MTGAEIALVAGGISALSAVYGGYKEKQMNEFNAEVAENEAAAAQSKALWDEDTKRKDIARQMGAQRAGCSGVSLLSGSAGDVAFDSLTEGERDVAAIRYGGQVASTEALNKKQQFKESGRLALTEGIMEGGASLIGSYGKYKLR
jgi:hypothetical protein